MKLKVKYFGQIREFTQCNEEIIELPNVHSVDDFRNGIQKKYPSIGDVNYSIAVNQSLHSTALSDNDEVALLPPFAGG